MRRYLKTSPPQGVAWPGFAQTVRQHIIVVGATPGFGLDALATQLCPPVRALALFERRLGYGR